LNQRSTTLQHAIASAQPSEDAREAAGYCVEVVSGLLHAGRTVYLFSIQSGSGSHHMHGCAQHCRPVVQNLHIFCASVICYAPLLWESSSTHFPDSSAHHVLLYACCYGHLQLAYIGRSWWVSFFFQFLSMSILILVYQNICASRVHLYFYRRSYLYCVHIYSHLCLCATNCLFYFTPLAKFS
jgi:hypothetical protein